MDLNLVNGQVETIMSRYGCSRRDDVGGGSLFGRATLPISDVMDHAALKPFLLIKNRNSVRKFRAPIRGEGAKDVLKDLILIQMSSLSV
jgi:hypothetical protein